jgi:hypothetical protein
MSENFQDCTFRNSDLDFLVLPIELIYLLFIYFLLAWLTFKIVV